VSKEDLKMTDGFWNIRDDFKVGGLLNVGTHASLVKRGNGIVALRRSPLTPSTCFYGFRGSISTKRATFATTTPGVKAKTRVQDKTGLKSWK